LENNTTDFNVKDYWNQSHLNPDGARKFTERLNQIFTSTVSDDVIEKSSTYTYQIPDIKFSENTIGRMNYERADSTFREIRKIRYNTMIEFLKNENQKIAFKDENIDTLRITFKDDESFSYVSTTNLGDFDSRYNDLLVQNLVCYSSNHDITEIELYAITPEEIGPISLPPWFPNNRDYEWLELWGNDD